ncbi:MAG: hypothetical protein JWQ94_4995 [Tardiphaga sp.]|nr:hypothetical protein [Tardiphaga sp.]
MRIKGQTAALFLLIPASAAVAMPMASIADAPTGVLQVDYACGPGRHETSWGDCRPNGWRRPPPRYDEGWDRPPPPPRYRGYRHFDERGPPPPWGRHFRDDGPPPPWDRGW